jgi:hypothetical protein
MREPPQKSSVATDRTSISPCDFLRLVAVLSGKKSNFRLRVNTPPLPEAFSR